MTSKTIFDKIWNNHSVGFRTDGKELLYIDRHVIHELHVPHAFSRLSKSKHQIHRKDLTIIVQDHTVPTREGLELISEHIKITREHAKNYGLQLIDVHSKEHGIVHVVSPELGLALPGFTLACPDSHASTVGAIGCLAFGCGTSELEHILVTQTMVLNKPKQMRINLTGTLMRGVGAKDIALKIIGLLGVDAGKGYAVEFAGPVIDQMSVEERMTLCNMSIEWSCRTCIIAPDQKTIDWCTNRSQTPTRDHWNEVLKYWETLKSDGNSQFDKEHTIECSNVGPQITWGTDPSQVLDIGALVPSTTATQDQAYAQSIKAMNYMGLSAGQDLRGLNINRVFIGSCSNSRINDLREVAQLVEGKQVASHVKALIVPGSTATKEQAESEGLDIIFKNAGFEWHKSGCSMCAGANGEVGQMGERCVSTSNRNFENRQGRGVRTHLASPQMAAAAALAGHIVDARDFLPAKER